ncbi:MAG: hypothetical protein ACLSFZ_01800 [Frisingicoccus sp.]
MADMRMNGSCAGGTGAFIDEVASILRSRLKNLMTWRRAVFRYFRAVRCLCENGHSALLNQGIETGFGPSAFHAIAKQTIGGLEAGY